MKTFVLFYFIAHTTSLVIKYIKNLFYFIAGLVSGAIHVFSYFIAAYFILLHMKPHH